VLWQVVDGESETKYQSIVKQLRAGIRSGELSPGDRLPTHRAMAKLTGVTISTVTQAYAEAARLHLASGQVGRGTFVLADSADASLFAATFARETADTNFGAKPTFDRSARRVPVEIDLSANIPAVDPLSTDLVDTLRALTRRNANVITEGYPTTAALWRARLAMEHLTACRGVNLRAEDFVITAGAQHGLFAALLALAGPGSRVLAESLTFPGLKAVARQLKIELVPVALDEHGLDPADLRRQAKRTAAKVVVCVPSLQNPTGVSMNSQRRKEIASVLTEQDLVAIEDDVYGSLSDEACLAASAPNHTVLLTSVSKTIEAGLRIGAIAGPPNLLAHITPEVHMTSWPISTTSIEVLSTWCADGTAERRIAWQRQEIRARWNLANRILGKSTYAAAPHRFVPVTRNPDRIVERAKELGVLTLSSSALGVSSNPRKGLRLSLAGTRSRAELSDALQRVDAAIGHRGA
jgi:DNA-binding transcriptional MocR family regulator